MAKKEKKIKKEEKIEEIKEESSENKNELEKKIEELTNQVALLDDKNKRISAEMVNTLRRKDEEQARILKYKNEDILKELLLVCDNFERAINIDTKNDEISNFLKGMDMIYNSIKTILEKFEVTEIDALNKEFDPSFHQAVMTEEKEGVNANIVIEVMQKGYMYKDKVLRPSMVKVSK